MTQIAYLPALMLDRVLRASPDAICVAQMEDGRIRFANSGFCTLVGMPATEWAKREVAQQTYEELLKHDGLKF